MLNQISFDVLSSVVLVVMIKIHVCSEPPGLSDTELTIYLGFQFRMMDTMIITLSVVEFLSLIFSHS